MKIIHSLKFLSFTLLIIWGGCKEEKDFLKYAESLRKRNHIPGMAIAMINADSTLTLETLGVRRDGFNDKIQSTDLFHIGSNGKAMTSFAAAKLVEDQKIKWTTSFTELFPEWKNDIDSVYWDISLGDLLSHRARIQPFWSDVEFDSITIQEATPSLERKEFVQYVLKQEPAKTDSVGFLYSNAGYSIAAVMMEKASCKTWEDLMIGVFKNDLDIDLGFGWPNKKEIDQPWGHWTENGKLFPCPPEDDYSLDWIEPGGDIHISMLDYIKFIQINLKGLEGVDGYLSSSTIQLLHSDKKDNIYGYGWGKVIKNGKQYSFHGGSAGTFLINTSIDVSNNTGYIIMMNTDSPAAREVIMKLISRLESKFEESKTL